MRKEVRGCVPRGMTAVKRERRKNAVTGNRRKTAGMKADMRIGAIPVFAGKEIRGMKKIAVPEKASADGMTKIPDAGKMMEISGGEKIVSHENFVIIANSVNRVNPVEETGIFAEAAVKKDIRAGTEIGKETEIVVIPGAKEMIFAAEETGKSGFVRMIAAGRRVKAAGTGKNRKTGGRSSSRHEKISRRSTRGARKTIPS